MNLIAIDQSLTSSGVTVFDTYRKELLDFQIIKTTNKTKQENFTKEERIFDIIKAIDKKVKQYHCTFLALEGLSLKNRNSISARDLAGLYYGILLYCLNNNIQYYIVAPKSVKAFVQKGNMEKEEMFQLLPEEIKNKFSKSAKKSTGLYDLTDSYFIGRYVLEKMLK